MFKLQMVIIIVYALLNRLCLRRYFSTILRPKILDWNQKKRKSGAYIQCIESVCVWRITSSCGAWAYQVLTSMF